MDDIAADNAAAGGYVITSSRLTSNTSVKNTYYPSTGATHLYNFHGNIDSTVWNNYGYTGDLGLKVVIDRDGYLRYSNSDAIGAEAVLLECLGVS